MIKNKQYIYKNITNNKNIELLMSNDTNYYIKKKDISLNTIFINNIYIKILQIIKILNY